MKREIKFRGKCVCTGEWRYGNLDVQPDGRMEIFSRADGLQKGMVIPETVGQFTGLKDCRGNDIYEGDILVDGKYLTYPVQILWVDGGFRLDVKEWHFYDFTLRYEKVLQGKSLIVGNVHDDPYWLEDELHKGK